jgi:PAS domain S-box-containing protein
MPENSESQKDERLLNAILDSIAEGVFTVDRDFIITSFNRGAERITGFSREEAIGRPCASIFHASICQDRCALKQTLETRRELVDVRIDIINRQGKRTPVSISTATLKDGKGNFIGGVETFRDLSAMEELRKEIRKQYSFEDIISKNHKILEMFRILPDIAESDSTVLIQGPSGSGKELFARALYNLSFRKEGPFVAVNCGVLPDNLLESELFGYVRGAFTGAEKDKPGRFAAAEGGTMFLDEIGEMSPALQVKLLRVLQEKEYEPLGTTEKRKANVRIIAASNQDLSALVKKGDFREDLFYRINVIKLELPPLSERREDIPLLVDFFIDRFNRRMSKNIRGVSEEVMSVLMRHDFPGNVRELENFIERAFVLCRSEIIEFDCLPDELLQGVRTQSEQPSLAGAFENEEARIILEALKRNGGNRTKTAQELEIDKSTLWRKMKKYNITGI